MTAMKTRPRSSTRTGAGTARATTTTTRTTAATTRTLLVAYPFLSLLSQNATVTYSFQSRGATVQVANTFPYSGRTFPNFV